MGKPSYLRFLGGSVSLNKTRRPTRWTRSLIARFSSAVKGCLEGTKGNTITELLAMLLSSGQGSLTEKKALLTVLVNFPAATIALAACAKSVGGHAIYPARTPTPFTGFVSTDFADAAATIACATTTASWVST